MYKQRQESQLEYVWHEAKASVGFCVYSLDSFVFPVVAGTS